MFFVSSAVWIPHTNSYWPMFQADPFHSGVGTGNPVLTPTLLWEDTNYSVSSSPAVFNDVIYIGSCSDVYALNATNGAKLWNYYIGTGNLSLGSVAIPPPASTSTPAVANGIVYIGSFDDNIYALNATNRDKIWNYTTSGAVASSPVVVNGVVYVGSDDGNIYALNTTNGDKLWSYSTGIPIETSPAAVNGVVYVSSAGGSLYAIGASSTSSASPTPTTSSSPTVPEVTWLTAILTLLGTATFALAFQYRRKRAINRMGRAR